MRATLHITSGAYAGRKISLRDGEIAQFGRTERADYSFPADRAMADRHFRVQCAARQCSVQDLQSASGTLVDGRAVEQLILRTGNVITAGQTAFLVVLGDDAVPTLGSSAAAQSSGAATKSATESAIALPIDLQPFIKSARLGDKARQLLQEPATVADGANALLEQGLVDDALGLVAVALTPVAAVAWATSNLRGSVKAHGLRMDAENEVALALAEQWLVEPSDERARQCQAAAEKLELATPPAFAAFSAFFANGNLAPADSDPIAVPPGVCGNAARSCLLLTSALLPPLKVQDERRKYVADALARLATAK